MEFKNVTIIYDEENVNKKLCKKKDRYMALWRALSILLLFTLFIFGAWATCVVPMFITITVFLMLSLGIATGFLYFGRWLIYHKTTKAFFFIEWLFEEVEEVYAGWFNNKILLRVQYFNRICDYSLQEFVGKIQNELVITDKSEKGRLIHIYIDVTSNEKTEIVIENIEN